MAASSDVGNMESVGSKKMVLTVPGLWLAYTKSLISFNNVGSS
jgi:hypothetical protein